jgi:pimeloyl-ACP methyl ester carboxylesterase
VPTFRSHDGLEIAYDCWGDPEGAPVLLHHGFAATAQIDWVETGVVDALTAAGRRVVAPDARGHGRSDKPHSPSRLGEARMAEDVETLIQELGATHVDLVGYSMGAIVALITATRSPRVRRLVVGGVGAAVAELGGVDARVLSSEALREALLTDNPSSITNPNAAAFRSFTEATGADRVALAAQTVARHRDRIPLEDVSVPTLVLAGLDDPLATRPEVLAAAILHSRLQLIPGDHGGVLREPGFRDAIVAFLAEGREGHNLPMAEGDRG